MQKEEIDKIINTPFFFIIGRPRSGTTLLRTMFDAHPNVCIPLEHSNLIHLQFKFGKTLSWNKKELELLFNEFNSYYIRKHWKYDGKTLRENLLETDENIDFQSLIKIIYSHYQSAFPKKELKYFADKSPINSLYLLKLYKNSFNEAKYIYLCRDPRDSILSMLKLESKLFSPSIVILANAWKQSVKQYFTLNKIADKQVYFIKYESLINNSEKELRQICDFLGIEYVEEMKEYHAAKHNYSEKFINKLHKKLFTAPDKTNVNKWKTELSTAEIKKIEFHCGKYLNKCGYINQYDSFTIFYTITQIGNIIIIFIQNMNRKIFDILPLYLKKKIAQRKFVFSRSIYLFFKKKRENNV